MIKIIILKMTFKTKYLQICFYAFAIFSVDCPILTIFKEAGLMHKLEHKHLPLFKKKVVFLLCLMSMLYT